MGRYDRQGGFGNAMANEAERQIKGRLIAKIPFARDAYNLWFRYQSGALMQPRVLIPLIASILVFLGGAIVSCVGIIGGLIATR